MSQDIQFKALARKAYLSYHQDGLIDVLIGWAMLAFGINLATDESIWTLIGWLPFLFYIPLKNRITIPRLGYVQFSQERRRTAMGVVSLVLLMLAMAGILAVLFFDVPLPPAILRLTENPALLYGLLVGFGFLLAGMASEIRRLFAYAALSVLIMGGGQLFGFHEAVPFLLVSGTILTTGLVMAIRFVRKYPIATGEEMNHVAH